MAQDVEERLESLEQKLSEIPRLRARIRTLESRLMGQGLSISNEKGRSRRIRLASDGESVEVE